MSEHLCTHEIICFLHICEVFAVNRERNTHPHVLSALDNLFTGFKKIGTFERFESEIIKDKVALVINHGLNGIRVLTDQVVECLTDYWHVAF